MNIEAILKTAAAIEAADPKNFDMSDWLILGDEASNESLSIGEAVHTCGTVACIAGWVIAANRPDARCVDRATAAHLLCIDADASYRLFVPDADIAWDSITPAVAAATLRHLAETGVVDFLANGASEQVEQSLSDYEIGE